MFFSAHSLNINNMILSPKARKIASIIGIVYLCAFLFNSCNTQTYKFGVLEEKYPEFFLQQDPKLNRVTKYNEKYSNLTRVLVEGQIIEIEHGAIATADDIKRLNLPNDNYLFMSIGFHRVFDPNNKNLNDLYKLDTENISVIDASLAFEQKNLEPAGAYIFRSFVKDNCEREKSKPNWDIHQLKGSDINERCEFGFIKVFKIPKNLANGELNSSMQKTPIQQTIKIVKNNKPYVFLFDIEWHPSSSDWWKFIQIT